MSNRKIIFIRAWREYSVGRVIEPYGVLREQLLKSGFAEIYEEPPTPAAECAAPAPEVFARLDVEEVPSAAGAPTAVIERQQTRKKHGR